MTQREKLIVSAYTGFLLTSWEDFHEFVENVLGRSIYTHDFANETFKKELKAKVKPAFLKICNTKEENSNIDMALSL